LEVKGNIFSFQVGDKALDAIVISIAYASNTSGLDGGANKYTKLKL